MSEATTLEAPESTPSTPVSEAPAELSSTEEIAPPSTGTETPEGEGAAPQLEQVTPKPLEEWTLEELDQKASREGLNPDEIKRFKSLDQSRKDRDAWERDQLDKAAKADEEVRTKINAVFSEHYQYADQQIAALRDGQDLELTRERIAASLVATRDQARTFAEAPIHKSLNDLFLHPNFYGDSAQNRKALAGMTIAEKQDVLMRRAYELGQKAPPSADHVVMTKAEFEKAKKDYAKSEIDAYKAANPGTSPPSGSGARTGGGKFYSQMTPEERASLSDSERDQLVAAEAATRRS